MTLLPLHNGDLGIGVFHQRNNAFHLEWLWIFTQEKRALWKKVVTYVEHDGWMTLLLLASLKPKGKAKGRPWFDIPRIVPL